MAHAWKACLPKGIEGSNPSSSAQNKRPDLRQVFYFAVGKMRDSKAGAHVPSGTGRGRVGALSERSPS